MTSEKQSASSAAAVELINTALETDNQHFTYTALKTVSENFEQTEFDAVLLATIGKCLHKAYNVADNACDILKAAAVKYPDFQTRILETLVDATSERLKEASQSNNIPLQLAALLINTTSQIVTECPAQAKSKLYKSISDFNVQLPKADLTAGQDMFQKAKRRFAEDFQAACLKKFEETVKPKSSLVDTLTPPSA